MSRKDKRPESAPERAQAGEEISAKATNPGIFDEQGGGSQTPGGDQRGAETGEWGKGPGQYTDRGMPSQMKK